MAVITVCLLAGGSILFRSQRGKPILQPDLAELRFFETWRAGQSDRRLLGRWLGSALPVLWVAVTKDSLEVGPRFPLNLLFVAEAFGWDHSVPGRSIVDIRETSRLGAVAIRYRHRTGDLELLKLSVHDRAALVTALRAIQLS
ncbi:MAG: hypothetical protein FJ145_17710 [Deltaproteobacteria bacterium]|nr:hypothetical protein [Deltaproteobacteria bacterium]